MQVFGEDRVIFDSDWPNSDDEAPLEKIFSVVTDYFKTQPRIVAEKYFWMNSARAYKWVHRAPNQPRLS